MPPRVNKRSDLLDATVRVVARDGVARATTRAIAREAGVTEGAIYRHYRSKGELREMAFAQIIERMMGEKRHLVDSSAPLKRRLHEWVELTYAFFDRHEDAFVYVFLRPTAGTTQLTAWPQGELFMRMIERAQARGEARRMTPALALSHFSGMLLNVPRLISDKLLERPALQYVDEVAQAAWTVLKQEQEKEGPGFGSDIGP